MTLAVIATYLVVLLGIGFASQRLLAGTGEDFFVATRSIGPFVLLMSLFGTHMTAFALLGASGEAYHTGVGVFALMASSSALVVPAVFLFLGTRVWQLGKEHGHLTQVQLYRQRWGSDRLGLLLFVVLVALLVPYLLIGVKGAGVTLEQITGGQIREWLGSLLVCAVVLSYVLGGGLRGTAWANTFQTLVFMTLGAVTYWLIVHRLGGLEVAMTRIAESHPELLVRGERIGSAQLFSYTLIPLSVAMFPHIYQHWLSARRASAFRLPIIGYPICIAIVWVPSVVLGVLGRLELPGLAGPAANGVLVGMIDRYAPGALGGLLAAGVLAAIMSSLDSQALSLSTMFTEDIVLHYGFHDRMSERQQVLSGRLFVVALVGLTYLLSLVTDASIFHLGVWSFSGFAALSPVAFAVFWRRSTRQGVTAAVLAAAASWIVLFWIGHDEPHPTIGSTGLLPVVAMLASSTVALVVVSLLTRPPEAAAVGER